MSWQRKHSTFGQAAESEGKFLFSINFQTPPSRPKSNQLAFAWIVFHHSKIKDSYALIIVVQKSLATCFHLALDSIKTKQVVNKIAYSMFGSHLGSKGYHLHNTQNGGRLVGNTLNYANLLQLIRAHLFLKV